MWGKSTSSLDSLRNDMAGAKNMLFTGGDIEQWKADTAFQ